MRSASLLHCSCAYILRCRATCLCFVLQVCSCAHDSFLHHIYAAESKFAVYDLVENKAPKNFFEAAEAGDSDMIIRMIERTLDFDVNQKVGHCTLHCQHVPNKLQPVPHLSLDVIS